MYDILRSLDRQIQSGLCGLGGIFAYQIMVRLSNIKSHMPLTTLIFYVIPAADFGYDDYQLYKFSTDKRFKLVCPVSEIYNRTSSDRLQLINFYDGIMTGNLFLEKHICRAVNRAYQRCLQNRSFTDEDIRKELQWYWYRY